MFKSVRNTVLLFIFILVCFPNCKKERIEGPAIRFKNEVYDFGEVNEGEVVTHTFSFINPGSDTLILESVRVSCHSCTYIEDYDAKVAPGGSGKIRVTYKSGAARERVDRKVYVNTNVPDRKELILVITGNVGGELKESDRIEVTPQPLMFGQINKGDSVLEGKVRIRNFFDKALEVTDIIPPNERTKVTVDVLHEGKELMIDIKVYPPFKTGDNGEIVTLKTNLEEWQEIVIPYVYSFNPAEEDINNKK